MMLSVPSIKASSFSLNPSDGLQQAVAASIAVKTNAKS
jgi:hypothetical protein